MQQTISPPAIPARAIPLPAREAQKVSTVPARAPAIAVPIAIVWHETLSAVASQFGIILPCILAFALITSVIASLNTLHVLGLNPQVGYAIGVLVMAFIRGAIVWIGLQDQQGRSATVHDLFRNVSRKWPALIVSSVVYGTVMAFGAARLDVMRQKVQSQLAEATSATHPVTVIAFITAAAQRDAIFKLLDGLIPRPGQPYENWFARQRVESTVISICNDSGLTAHEITQSMSYSGQPDPCAGSTAPPPVLTDVESAFLLFIGEILLCFSTVAAFRPAHTGHHRWGVIGFIAPLVDSARLAVRRFGCVAVHIWLLHLCIAAFGALPLVIPPQLALNYDAITLRLPGAQATIVSFAAFSTLLISTFQSSICLIYEARLYATLCGRQTMSDRLIGLIEI